MENTLITANKNKLSELVLLTKSYKLQDFKDWIHWHLDIIGFDHCHVFDNESSVDIKSVCDSYGDKVTYAFVKGWPDQYALYNRYINNESQALWVFQCDDDEFLYVSDKYRNNINEALLDISEKYPTWNKLCIGWRNLFPLKFTKERTNEHLILNATGFSHEACKHWQRGDTPVKTFVKLVGSYNWKAKSHGHNPTGCGESHTLNGEVIPLNFQKHPTKGTEDLILFHYQFKADNEWRWKCKNRKSPTNKAFIKNYPENYKKLYRSHTIREDNRMKELWLKYEV